MIVLPCEDLEPTLAFFTEKLGFRVDLIFPADDPSSVEISGHGLRLRLELRTGTTELPVELPPFRASFVLSRLTDGAGWHLGRAGMQYRDLIPGRQGGHVIASHIRIPEGGPVSDYVHFHEIAFQMIYCYKGWVRVVYEDQGPPFVLHPGDCVLQPPRIRHRVLESSAGLEVIEVSSPARHQTRVDHDLELPTRNVKEDRHFAGQRFVHHIASDAEWAPWGRGGFEARNLGIAEATGGKASSHVIRPTEDPSPEMASHTSELHFLFVLQGGFTLRPDRHAEERLTTGDSVVVPGGMRHAFQACSDDLELLEVTLSASLG